MAGGLALAGLILVVLALIYRSRQVQALRRSGLEAFAALARGAGDLPAEAELEALIRAHKLKGAELKAAGLQAFEQALGGALAGPGVGAEEQARLERLAGLYRLGPQEQAPARERALAGLFKERFEPGDFSLERERAFLALARGQGVEPDQCAALALSWRRWRLLGHARLGRFLPVEHPKVLLQPGETCVYQVPCRLMEERVVERHFEGGSQGVSIRIARGVTYRVGHFRGRPVSTRGVVPVDAGTFVLTDQRIIYAGASKNLTVAWKDLLSFEVHSDCIQLSPTRKAKAEYLQSDDVPLMAEMVQAALDHFRPGAGQA